MTLKEKIELLEKLKEEYFYSDDRDLEKLRNKFEELHLSEVDFIYDKEHEHGKLFVCPDLEWEFPVVFEVDSEVMYLARDIIYNAIALYYKECDFWENVVGITEENLVKIYTRLNNIPIIRFFSVSNVELLNVRKLNSDVR